MIVRIRCPHCNAEYIPEEIFYPNSVFNKNIKVIRDEVGKIVLIEGEYSFDLNESFECECCGEVFSVLGEAKFSTSLKEDKFEEETIIKL